MTISFGDGAEKVLDLRDDLEDEHDDATEESVDTLQNAVRRGLVREDSIASGNLFRDIRTARTVGPLPSVFTSHAVHLPEFAKWVEHGTGTRGAKDSVRGSIPYPEPSGVPPLEPILSWIIAKNITPTEYDTRYGLAAAIQETIGELGTFAHPFIRPAWRGPRGKRNIIDANRTAMNNAVRRF